MSDDLTTELDRWLSLLDEGRLAADVRRKEQEADELEARLRAEAAELHRLRDEIRKAHLALEFRRELMPTPVDGNGAPRPAAQEESESPAPPRGREAIRRLLAERPDVLQWTIPTVLTELVSRGWAQPDDEHAVGVSLSRMARAKELHRPRKGVYELPREDGGDTLHLNLGDGEPG